MKFKDLLELITLPLKYLIALFLVLVILLFSPKDFMIKIGIVTLVNSYRTYIGLAFLLVMLLIFTHISDYILKILRSRYIYSSLVRKGKKRLRNLTDSEKEILRRFIEKGTKSVYLSMNNGNVASLCEDKIIYRSCGVSRSYLDFAYNLNEWAWEYLNKNKWLLD